MPIFAMCIPFIAVGVSLAAVLAFAGSHAKIRELARDAEHFEDELRRQGVSHGS